jgi:hypothetical protein
MRVSVLFSGNLFFFDAERTFFSPQIREFLFSGIIGPCLENFRTVLKIFSDTSVAWGGASTL